MSGVLAILEQRGGAWNRMSWEAFAAGREIAKATGEPLTACVPGYAIEPLLPDLMCRDAAKVYAVSHPLLENYTADGYTAALEQLVKKVAPEYVVFPHTYQVRDFAPRLATRFGQTLIADVVSLEIRDGRPVFIRQLMQGKLNGAYAHSGQGPCFVSVQAGAFAAEGLEAGTPECEAFAPELAESRIRATVEPPFREATQTVDLSSAPIIVSVGRGIQSKDNLPVMETLAEALGAELAASRPICDSGWLPMERQVGSSGQTVAPKVYFAVGISGAIQHLIGMKGSKCIVAINKDESAPIFEVADYGIVGDLFEVVPALTEAVRRAKS